MTSSSRPNMIYLFTLKFFYLPMRPGLAQPLTLGGQGRPGGGNVTWPERDTRARAISEKITGLRESGPRAGRLM